MCVGTYNNQYMVLDLKKVHLNNVLEDDALWVAEQVPGCVCVHVCMRVRVCVCVCVSE